MFLKASSPVLANFGQLAENYLEQYDTKSGVWFLYLRQPDNVPKGLKGWMSPTGMLELLDITARNQALQDMEKPAPLWFYPINFSLPMVRVKIFVLT